MKFVEYKIKGMTCDHCAQTITKKFSENEGIVSKDISYPAGSGKFEYDPAKISKEEIAEIVNSTGHYKVVGEAEGENTAIQNFDLIIVGGGSAAFSAAIKAESLGLSTLMVNAGLDFGGTCVNVGCVPSKNLIRAGETVYHATHSNFTGITPKGVDIDFAQVVKDKKKLVATLQEKKYMDVVSDFESLTMLKGWATFKDSKTIEVDGKDYKALKFLIATGATTNIPNIEALDKIDYLTNVSLFNLEERPESLTIMGAGYIGLEIAMAYNHLGVKVRIIEFTDPQVAGTGLDEAQAKAQNIPFEVSKIELKDVPRAIAANDTRGFIKLIRNTETDKHIGARVVAPKGGELIQQLSMAIKYGITIKDLSESLYPYLTLSEGIKLAAITFGKDVSKLSCCAS